MASYRVHAPAATMLVVLCLVGFGTRADDAPGDAAGGEGGPGPSDADVFRRLLLQKRVEQLSAVQRLLALEDASRRAAMVDAMLDKMKGVLQRGRAQLEASGLAARVADAESFPENEVTRTTLAHVMENTCFLGDVLLRLPDLVHRRFAQDREWAPLFGWCLAFAESSGLADPSTLKLLHLAAQEAGLREKDPEYHNPYRQEKKRHKRFEDPPPKKKKERKKLPRGPRMSKTEL